jgi:lipopolysaccharide transport system ATP-binding protein
VWSLRDINFEIEQGDAVGIIGRNGAGKSTLLKLLSKVTQPTTGSFKVNGRIASLLEVGTGFNPEMTGRENIYLNGAILGMRRHEITRKLDEIIDFSGVERYIDTPVKRYSSGMYVRLAFAVAAHLESEILIVDEVLAVGDAEFQKKCLGKMGDVSKGEGRTVLFVSHNIGAIQTLCNKGILLDKGQLLFEGLTDKTIDYYSNLSILSNQDISKHYDYNQKIEIIDYQIYSELRKLASVDVLPLGSDLSITIKFKSKEEVSKISFAIDVNNSYNELVSHISNEDDAFNISKIGINQIISISIVLKQINYVPNKYFINFWIGSNQVESIYKIENLFVFDLEQGDFTKRIRPIPSHSRVFIKSNWKLL